MLLTISDQKRSQLRGNSIMILAQHSSHSSWLRFVLIVMHFDDLSMFDTFEKNSFICDSAFDRAIYLLRWSRTWLDLGARLSSLWNKGSPTAAKPRLERGHVSGLDLFSSSLTESRAFVSVFLLYVAIALRSARCAKILSSSKGDNVARIRDTSSTWLGTGISTNRKPPCRTKRNMWFPVFLHVEKRTIILGL